MGPHPRDAPEGEADAVRIIERILVLQRMHPRYGLGWLTPASSGDPKPEAEAISVIKVTPTESLSVASRDFRALETLTVPTDQDIDAMVIRIIAALSGKTFTCPVGALHFSHCLAYDVKRADGIQPTAYLAWSGRASWRTELPL